MRTFGPLEVRLFGRLPRRGSGPGRPRCATHDFEPGGDLYATAAADEWPEDWLQAIVIPLWNNKGNWRGITFLSEVQKSSLELSLAVCKILGNIYGRRATRVSEKPFCRRYSTNHSPYIIKPCFAIFAHVANEQPKNRDGRRGAVESYRRRQAPTF